MVHNVPAAPAIAGPTAAALKGTYAITMAAVLLMYWASINVSLGRGKYKVRPPATTGVSDDFDRIFRVQANTIEQVIQFLPALWVFSLFVSPAISTAAGAVWVLGRVLYAKGYYEKAAARGAGFGIASLASNFLIAGACAGAWGRRAEGPRKEGALVVAAAEPEQLPFLSGSPLSFPPPSRPTTPPRPGATFGVIKSIIA